MVLVHKATGLNPKFILDELPLSQGYAYIHAARLMDGECLMFYDQTATEDDHWISEAKKRQEERSKRFDRLHLRSE